MSSQALGITDMTPDLSAIRARAEAATPHDKAACDAFGPHMGCSYCWGVVRPEPYLLTLPGEHEERALVPDAAFWDAVAHLELARDDRAALLAEVERLRAVLKEVHPVLHNFCEGSMCCENGCLADKVQDALEAPRG